MKSVKVKNSKNLLRIKGNGFSTTNGLSTLVNPTANVSYLSMDLFSPMEEFSAFFKSKNTADIARFQSFAKEWINTFQPRILEKTAGNFSAQLILHYILVHAIMDSSVHDYMCTSKSLMVAPSYQSATFQKVACPIQTNFTSRCFGRVGSDQQLSRSMELIDILCGTVESDNGRTVPCEQYRLLVESISVSADFQKSFVVKQSQDTFINTVSQIRNFDMVGNKFECLLTVNNACVTELNRTLAHKQPLFGLDSFKVDRSSSDKLGLMKYRNFGSGSYTIQESGWNSYSSDDARNLAIIHLFWLKPKFYFSSTPDQLDVRPIGSDVYIPCDLVLHDYEVDLTELFTSLFSLYSEKYIAAGNGYLDDNPIPGQKGGKQNKNRFNPKREFSTGVERVVIKFRHRLNARFKRYIFSRE